MLVWTDLYSFIHSALFIPILIFWSREHDVHHEGQLALTANSLIPDRWTETKQASPLHVVLNKLDFAHFKREYDVLGFWNMNYSCTFSNLQSAILELTGHALYTGIVQDYDSLKYKEDIVGRHITPSVWHLQKQIIH